MFERSLNWQWIISLIFCLLFLTGGPPVAEAAEAHAKSEEVTLPVLPQLFPRRTSKSMAYFSGGLVATRIARTSKSSTGEIGRYDYVAPTAGIVFDLATANRAFVNPAIFYTPFGKKDRDRASSTRVLIFAFPLVYALKHVQIKFGPGLLFYRVEGDGGEIELDNGSSKSTFYKPKGSSTARMLYATVGAGLISPVSPWPDVLVRVDADWMITAPLDSKARTVNFMASAGVGIPLFRE